MSPPVFVDEATSALRAEFRTLLRRDAGDAIQSVEKALIDMGDASFVAAKRGQFEAEKALFGDLAKTNLGRVFGVANNAQSILGNAMDVFKTDAFEAITGVEKARIDEGDAKNTFLSRILGAQKYIPGETPGDKSTPPPTNDKEKSSSDSVRDVRIVEDTSKSSDSVSDVRIVDTASITDTVRETATSTSDVRSSAGEVSDVRIVENFGFSEKSVETAGELTVIGRSDDEMVGLLDEIRDGIIDLIGAVRGADAADEVRARMDARRSTEASREGKRGSVLGAVVAGGEKPAAVAGGFADEVVGEVIGSAIGAAAGGGLAGLAAKSMKFGAVASKVGLRALPVVGSVLAVGLDAFSGYDMAEEWDTTKVSGVLGTILGGSDDGFKGAFAGAGKWGMTGAAIGSVVPVVGTIAGGLVGAAIGSVLGFVGGENIARMFDGAATAVGGLAGDLKDGISAGLASLIDRVGGWVTDNIMDPLGTFADEAFGTSFVLDEESLSVEVDALTSRMSERETEIVRTSRSLNEAREALVDAVSRGDQTMIASMNERISNESARLDVLRSETEEDSTRLDVAGVRLSSSRRKWIDAAGEWADRSLLEPMGRLADNMLGTSMVLDEESLKTELDETRTRVAEREAVWETRRHALAVVVRDMVSARDSGDVALISSLEARERTMRSSFEDMARSQHRDEKRIVELDEMVSDSTSKVVHRVGNWLDLNVGGVMTSVADGILGTDLSTDEQDARMAELGASIESSVGGVVDRVAEALTFEMPELPEFSVPDVSATWDEIRDGFRGMMDFDAATLSSTPTVAALALAAAGGIGTFFGDTLGFDEDAVPDLGLADTLESLSSSLSDWIGTETWFDEDALPSVGILGMATGALGGLEALFRGATTFEVPETPDVGAMVRGAADSIGAAFADMDLDFDLMFDGAVAGVVGFKDSVVGGLSGFVTRVSDFVGRIFSWDYWFGGSDPGADAKETVARARLEEERRARLVTSLDESAVGTSTEVDEVLERFRRGDASEVEVESVVRETRASTTDASVVEDLGEALRAFEETRISRRLGEDAVERRSEFIEDLRGSIDSFGIDSDSVSVTTAIREFETGQSDLSGLREELVRIEGTTSDRNERWEAKEALELFGAYESFEREATATRDAERRSSTDSSRSTSEFEETKSSRTGEVAARSDESVLAEFVFGHDEIADRETFGSEVLRSESLTDVAREAVREYSEGGIDGSSMLSSLTDRDVLVMERILSRAASVDSLVSDRVVGKNVETSLEKGFSEIIDFGSSRETDSQTVRVEGLVSSGATGPVIMGILPEGRFDVESVVSLDTDPTRLGDGNRVDEETRALERERAVAQAMVVNSRVDQRTTNSRTSVTIPASVHNEERTFASGASGVY